MRQLSLTCLTVVWLLLYSVQCGYSVVTSSGDGSGNTVAPADDPGFANVGTRGVGTAIYLGNRWVLTAAHLGPGSVNFGGKVYNPIGSEMVRLGNPAEMTPDTDMLLLRIPEDPQLPALRLPCDPVRLGSNFVMVGNGHDRNIEPTFWEVDEKPGANDDVWTVVDSEQQSDRMGFETQSSQSIRWGIGSVGVNDVVRPSDEGDVLTFTSSFNQSLNVDGLSQAVRGDSGGAAFQMTAGVWELIGMIYAVDNHENQPGATRTAVYGNSTLIADLFRYAGQIRAAADFEPALGDVDGDGSIEANEIDAMHVAVKFGVLGSCHFDLDANDVVNSDDFSALLDAAGTLLGDTDLDGVVGFSDFLAMSQSFGTDARGWSNGDFDGDGKVAFSDFLDLSAQFGNSTLSSSAHSIPEPRSPAWLLSWLCLIWVGRKVARP